MKILTYTLEKVNFMVCELYHNKKYVSSFYDSLKLHGKWAQAYKRIYIYIYTCVCISIWLICKTNLLVSGI